MDPILFPEEIHGIMDARDRKRRCRKEASIELRPEIENSEEGRSIMDARD